KLELGDVVDMVADQALNLTAVRALQRRQAANVKRLQQADGTGLAINRMSLVSGCSPASLRHTNKKVVFGEYHKDNGVAPTNALASSGDEAQYSIEL
ncbi:hypothetical protein TW65_09295, partial [Stemphylium lycopersici]